jgi:hypothetical protein
MHQFFGITIFGEKNRLFSTLISTTFKQWYFSFLYFFGGEFMLLYCFQGMKKLLAFKLLCNSNLLFWQNAHYFVPKLSCLVMTLISWTQTSCFKTIANRDFRPQSPNNDNGGHYFTFCHVFGIFVSLNLNNFTPRDKIFATHRQQCKHTLCFSFCVLVSSSL